MPIAESLDQANQEMVEAAFGTEPENFQSISCRLDLGEESDHEEYDSDSAFEDFDDDNWF